MKRSRVKRLNGPTNATGASNDENKLRRRRRGSFGIMGRFWIWGLDDFFSYSSKCMRWLPSRAGNGLWVITTFWAKTQWRKRKNRDLSRVFWEISNWKFWSWAERESRSHERERAMAEEGKAKKNQFIIMW